MFVRLRERESLAVIRKDVEQKKALPTILIKKIEWMVFRLKFSKKKTSNRKPFVEKRCPKDLNTVVC